MMFHYSTMNNVRTFDFNSTSISSKLKDFFALKCCYFYLKCITTLWPQHVQSFLLFLNTPKTCTFCVCVNAVLSTNYISVFFIFSRARTANKLISLFLYDCVCKWNHNYEIISDLLELILLHDCLPRKKRDPLRLEKFCFIRRVKSSKFSPGI